MTRKFQVNKKKKENLKLSSEGECLGRKGVLQIDLFFTLSANLPFAGRKPSPPPTIKSLVRSPSFYNNFHSDLQYRCSYWRIFPFMHSVTHFLGVKCSCIISWVYFDANLSLGLPVLIDYCSVDESTI